MRCHILKEIHDEILVLLLTQERESKIIEKKKEEEAKKKKELEEQMEASKLINIVRKAEELTKQKLV